MRKIKLIWDFRGGDAKGIADHHCIHLEQFAVKEQLSINHTGVEMVTDMHAMAYMVVEEQDMIKVRDALRPHRAVLAE